MAFIRRHRLVLAPLFLAVAAGLALLLLLGSNSEEPVGNVGSSYPRETVQAWQEDVPKRSQHGREYRFVHTVEHRDPQTGETVTDEMVSIVRERGTNVCCRDADGNWVPTEAEWESGGLGFRMKRNSWQVEVPLTLGSSYQYTVGDRAMAMRPNVLLLSDGVHTVSLGEVNAAVYGEIDARNPSKLVFADVLGKDSGIDIELVLERASFHQNVVLRSKPALPQGFDEDNARLYVYTELGLDALTAEGDVGVRIGETPVNTSAADLVTTRNTRDPIVFTLRETVAGRQQDAVLHQFVESRVWDGGEAWSELCAARQLYRDPNTLKTYLVESIPYAYVADATGALTLDYESRNGTIDEDEIWTADATYYVSGNVSVGAGKTLTIEPGTIVKFDEGSYAIKASESDAKIVAMGQPYNYIVFTSKNDDSAGEDLTPGEATTGSRSDYSSAIDIGYDASTASDIAYCKAAFGTVALRTGVRLANPVRHCIVYDAWTGIGSIRADSEAGTDVFNCLLRNCSDGVVAWVRTVDPDPSCEIWNCTFDSCGSGFYANLDTQDNISPSFILHDNLFTSCVYGDGAIRVEGTATKATWDLENNAFWDCAEDYDTGIPGGSIAGTITVTADPYESGVATGDFYLNNNDPGGAQCRNAGSQNYSDAGLDEEVFTFLKPESIPDGGVSASVTWDRIEAGDQWFNDGVSIGYHHNRIDRCIAEEIEIGDDIGGTAVTLTINPGVVVAFAGSDARLNFDWAEGDTHLACDGEPDDFIILAGKPIVSMDVEAQYTNSSWWDYPHKGVLLNNPGLGGDTTASITYTRVAGLHKGVEVSFDVGPGTGSAIQHCIFERGMMPLILNGADDREIAISNCLLRDDVRGALFDLNSSTSTTMALDNCTFDGHDVGLVVKEGAQGASATVENCLFTNCNNGIRANDSAALANLLDGEDYNAYWDCGPGNSKKIWKEFTPYGEAEVGEDSLVLLADPYDPAWFDAQDPASADWSAQWYLVQDGSTFSACVDGGSKSSHAAGLDTFTTKLDAATVWFDIDQVDIGYHYPVDESVVDLIAAGGITVTGLYFNPQTAGSVTITINLDDDATWSAVVKDADETSTIRTLSSQGADNPVVVEWDGWNDGHQSMATSGVYVIIVSIDGFSEELKFYVYLDRDAPDGFEITWPYGNVTGY